FLFFFQAEDGIRDFHVTGVQTCALPILKPFPRPCLPRSIGPAATLLPLVLEVPPLTIATIYPTTVSLMISGSSTRPLPLRKWPRSEERRVGKDSKAR